MQGYMFALQGERLYHITLCYTISWDIIVYYVYVLDYIVLCYIILWYIILYHITLHYIIFRDGPEGLLLPVPLRPVRLPLAPADDLRE